MPHLRSHVESTTTHTMAETECAKDAMSVEQPTMAPPAQKNFEATLKTGCAIAPTSTPSASSAPVAALVKVEQGKTIPRTHKGDESHNHVNMHLKRDLIGDNENASDKRMAPGSDEDGPELALDGATKEHPRMAS